VTIVILEGQTLQIIPDSQGRTRPLYPQNAAHTFSSASEIPRTISSASAAHLTSTYDALAASPSLSAGFATTNEQLWQSISVSACGERASTSRRRRTRLWTKLQFYKRPDGADGISSRLACNEGWARVHGTKCMLPAIYTRDLHIPGPRAP
jgi:hypothetical protein